MKKINLELNRAVCDVLGLDHQKVTQVTLTFDAHDGARAEVLQLVEVEEAKELCELLTEYELSEKTSYDPDQMCSACGASTIGW